MDLVWYVSYGSNMHADRFARYVAGGTPDGGNRRYPGCRDQTPPRKVRGCAVKGGVYFATWSPVWEGGRGFYDPDLPGDTYARAYLITEEQFADVYDQEMYREPGTTDLDLRDVLKNGRATLGEGRYETLIYIGHHDGYPMFTFTAPWSFQDLPRDDVPLNAPSAPYLRMLGHGLLAAHGWSLRRTAEHLADLRCAAGVWSAEEIMPMLYPYVILRCAMTVDGSIAPFAPSSDGDRTGEDEARARARCEAILVAADTVRINGATEVIDVGTPADLPAVLHSLAEGRGIRRLMVEADTTVFTKFLAGRLADELQLVVAPKFVDAPRTPRLVAGGVSRKPGMAELGQFDNLAIQRCHIKRWEVRGLPQWN